MLTVSALAVELLHEKTNASRDIRCDSATARQVLTTIYRFNGAEYKPRITRIRGLYKFSYMCSIPRKPDFESGTGESRKRNYEHGFFEPQIRTSHYPLTQTGKNPLFSLTLSPNQSLHPSLARALNRAKPENCIVAA